MGEHGLPHYFKGVTAEIDDLAAVHLIGRVRAVRSGVVYVSGLSGDARIGDQVQIMRRLQKPLMGEIVQFDKDSVVVLPDKAPNGVSLQDRVSLRERAFIAPCESWIGRVVDPSGRPLDGAPLLRGADKRALEADPPEAAARRAMGTRLRTGFSIFNTMLPIVRGQRVGLFAGSGVGKSNLIAQLAQNVDADLVVIAMIGERGRELRSFVDDVLGPEGMERSIIVAATSDQSPLLRRRCAWAAMAVAEYFRDKGLQVLLLADSITRFAEAHREVAIAAGEAPVLRGFPPSTSSFIMSLCERAGPGTADTGDITALFSVLVAGSDMDEPIADILRGVLDGHIVLDRTIAERGRYPAVDLLRSISRSLPAAASDEENALIAEAREMLGVYEENATMIRAGLYVGGSDPRLDQAVGLWNDLDAYVARLEPNQISDSFAKLGVILRRGRNGAPLRRPVG